MAGHFNHYPMLPGSLNTSKTTLTVSLIFFMPSHHLFPHRFYFQISFVCSLIKQAQCQETIWRANHCNLLKYINFQEIWCVWVVGSSIRHEIRVSTYGHTDDILSCRKDSFMEIRRIRQPYDWHISSIRSLDGIWFIIPLPFSSSGLRTFVIEWSIINRY